MRGFGKILMVAVVAAPIGFMAATPSGAAAPTSATCKAMAGSEVFTPPLPLKGSVALTVTIKNAKLTGCTGAGGASGLLSLTTKTKGSCLTLAKGATVKGTETITWSNKTSSSVALTQTSPFKKNALLASENGTVTKGTLAKKKQTFSILFVIPTKGFTGCTKTAVKSLPVKQGQPLVIK
jgi:hypothetical protein